MNRHEFVIPEKAPTSKVHAKSTRESLRSSRIRDGEPIFALAADLERWRPVGSSVDRARRRRRRKQKKTTRRRGKKWYGGDGMEASHL